MINKLKFNPDNPRKIGKDQLERIKRSIKEFPEMLEKRPIVYDDDFIVLGGNMRLKALRELVKDGFEIKDDYFLSAKGWSDEKKREFVIKDNLMDGEWDEEILADKWSDLPLNDWGLEDLEWETDEVIEDEPPEVSDEPAVSKLGEVYQLGRHRLMCGDSTKIEDVEKLMDGKKADMVFTDPPYGMDLDTDYSQLPSTKKEGNKTYSKVIGDDKQFNYQDYLWIECKEQIWFGANYYAKTLPDGGSWMVWDKRVEEKFDKMFGSGFEIAWSKTPHKQKIYRHNNTLFGGDSEARGKEHPTQKPTKLCAEIIREIGNDGNIVLDLFAGSGSTLIACEQTNRICYGMEIDLKYCDVIRKRYHKFTTGNEEGWIQNTPVII